MFDKRDKTAAAITRPVRRLEVSYVRRRHEDPKTSYMQRISRYASLTLNGDWLEQTGFPTGTVVNVSVVQGRLIIEQAIDWRGYAGKTGRMSFTSGTDMVYSPGASSSENPPYPSQPTNH